MLLFLPHHLFSIFIVLFLSFLNITLTKKLITFILSVVCITCLSCASGNAPEHTTATISQAPTHSYDNSLASGKVIDTVVCHADAGQSYSLYLPTHYDTSNPYPCIYFFDAHARGVLPLYMYKELAEQYGFVFIASNTSKNGIAWEQTNALVNTLMSDTRARIHIDPKRIYTSGFSGGARVASTIAMQDGSIAGVIGCSAGFPQFQNHFQNKFNYFGLVGNYDFNLQEMLQLDEAMNTSNFPHQLLTYNGIHDWPVAADFQTALLWMLLREMKDKVLSSNETTLHSFITDCNHRISVLRISSNWINLHRLLDATVKLLDGLTDVSTYRKQLSDLEKNTTYTNALKLQNDLQQAELTAQQQLGAQFTSHDEKWWAATIADMNAKSKNSKDIQIAHMNRRVLSYLGLVAYMNTNHAISTDDLSHAQTYLNVFKMADPKNPDGSYLQATLYMKKNDPSHALASLSNATTLGYNDVSQLNTDPIFASLHSNPDFTSIINDAKKNLSKK